MQGSIVNFFAIVSGSIIGIVFKERFPQKIRQTVMHGLSLAVILIGIQMALETNNVLVVIFSLVIGGLSGEIIAIEKKLNDFGTLIKNRFKNNNDLFVQGFVQSSLIFCVGAMAIMGSIQDGLNNDPTILYNKSILDGFASIAFAATFGLGVIFSAVPVLLYQGGITLLSSMIARYLTDSMVAEMTATGGLLILAIGLNMIGACKIKIGNLIPAIFVAVLLVCFVAS